jgi:hypothetical protein
MSTTVAMNLAGVIESPGLDSSPYLVDADGVSYVPVGDGGVVLGLSLGDGVFAFEAEHASPAVTVVHTDPAARQALTALACLGNRATVRTGSAAGASGVVLGKRGEEGSVLALFASDVLAQLVPGDAIAVRASGQGAQLPAALEAAGARLLNVDPQLLPQLPLTVGEGAVTVAARGIVGSKLIGNGIGRPAHQWNLDLQVDERTAAGWGLAGLSIGDLLVVQNLDVRHNAGYRAAWSTVGVVVTTGSRRPGHGPGVMPMLCLPTDLLEVTVQPEDHVGVTEAMLGLGQ